LDRRCCNRSGRAASLGRYTDHHWRGAARRHDALRSASSRHRLPREFIFASALWLAVAVAYGAVDLFGGAYILPLFFVVLVGWIGQNVNAHLMHVGIRLMATLVIADDDETPPALLLDRRVGVASLILNQLAVACGAIGLTIFEGRLLEAAAIFGICGFATMAFNVVIATKAAVIIRRQLYG
jgi:hypothetical protein